MEFFERLDAVRNRWNVLEHPFYQRWSAGELTADELSFYAAEYRHAVEALAVASEQAADAAEDSIRAEMQEHAREERQHVELWQEFERALGADSSRTPRPETAECGRAWTAARNSLNFGVFTTADPGGLQVAYARVLTDHANFGWLADVYVDRDHRGRGLGRMLVDAVIEHLEPIGLSRVLLATRDAHEVYARVGFEPLPNPEIFMIRS